MVGNQNETSEKCENKGENVAEVKGEEEKSKRWEIIEKCKRWGMWSMCEIWQMSEIWKMWDLWDMCEM